MKPALPALCALLLLPAPAVAAPALAPLKPCYVTALGPGKQPTSEAISLTGSGFTPGGVVELQMDGKVAGRTTASSDGALVYGLNAPIQRAGEREFTVAATETGLAPVTAVSRVAALGVAVKPKNAKPHQTVTFTGSGFTDPATPVYLHATLRGRKRRTVEFAQPTGPCGTFTVRRRQFPVRRPASGLWTFRFEQDARYRTQSVKPHFLIDVQVRRRLIKP